MNQIIQHLTNSKHVLVTSHINPDGDAVGSLVAMGLSLAALNKKATLYSETPVPAVYRFLPSTDRIVQHINATNTYDCAVILDCGDIERIGKLVDSISQIPVIINIDHHVTNTNFGDFHLIDSTACATAEIVYRLIKEMAVPIDKSIATSIYTGILTDTGSFRFENTTQTAFAICEEMVQMGVDPYHVAQHVYGTSLGRIQLLLLALNTIEISKNGNMSMMTLTQAMLNESRTEPEDIEGLINYARNIEDVEVAVLIQEKQKKASNQLISNSFHVSLRSNGSIDVADIAAAFGGGGHSSAAGFSVESTLLDLKAKLFKLAEDL